MELIDFIKEYHPKFDQTAEGWTIFTVATQHVKKPTLEEALEFCYYVIREKPILKYPTLGELMIAFKAGTLEEQELYEFRLDGIEIGYHPHWITRDELAIYCSPEAEKRNEELQNLLMWGNKEGYKP